VNALGSDDVLLSKDLLGQHVLSIDGSNVSLEELLRDKNTDKSRYCHIE
jgi:hypothetical protein